MVPIDETGLVTKQDQRHRRCLVTRLIGLKSANARSRVNKLLFRAMTSHPLAVIVDGVEDHVTAMIRSMRLFPRNLLNASLKGKKRWQLS